MFSNGIIIENKKNKKGVQGLKLSSEKLFIAMAEKEMNIKELSKKTGLSRKTISRQLNGNTTTRPDVIGNISKELNIQVEDLLEDEPGVAAPIHEN